MADAMRLVLGTQNRKKLAELAGLLAPHRFELLTLADFSNAVSVEETGSTFAENAVLKASVQARALYAWVLGEDSGLSVDALGGAPGVRSARYAGEAASDAANNQKLLEQLGDTPPEKRTARYTCHLALSDPQGNIRAECEASCRGRIRFRPTGNSGFGYDPLFEIVEYHRTFAEIGLLAKSVLSHRGRALQRFIPQLMTLLMPTSA
jgi:XTP/dITP diphosphohydrolase